MVAAGSIAVSEKSKEMSTWIDARPFVRGWAWRREDLSDIPDAHPRTWTLAGDIDYPRVKPGDSRIPVDTFDSAAIPAGLRLELIAPRGALEIELECKPPGAGAGAGAGAANGRPAVELWQRGRLLETVPALRGLATVRLSAPGGRVTVYLPDSMRPRPLRLRAASGVIDQPAQRQRWLAYGDSITEGMVASAPSRAWPAVVGRALDVEVINLGFAGAARGEIALAEQMVALGGDAFSVAVGTNCWSRVPTSVAQMEANMEAFLAVLRQARPGVPILVVSPILRPDAETTPNRLGATLEDLRAAIERAAQATPGTRLIRGRDLVKAEQLPDDLHPDDDGHAALAAAVAPVLAAAIGARSYAI
jgi:lysophospholipase L1-like esterase